MNELDDVDFALMVQVHSSSHFIEANLSPISLLISRRQEAKLPSIMNVQPPTFHIFTVYFF